MKNKYDANVLDAINKAGARPNGRKLLRRERALEREVQGEFDRQLGFVLGRYKKIRDRKKAFDGACSVKDIDSDLDGIFDDIDPELLVNIVIDHAKGAMELGGNYRVKESNLGQIGISFDLLSPLAVQYLESDRPLVLSTLSQTTKDSIKPILQEALQSGQSYTETARQLTEAFGFSPDRAQMIAVNEIGHAYEWGNYVPMQDAKAKGYKVEKKWSTVHDNRVTDECKANEAMSKETDGWIPLDTPFDSGDDTAPRDSNPRCRCTTLYRYS